MPLVNKILFAITAISFSTMILSMVMNTISEKRIWSDLFQHTLGIGIGSLVFIALIKAWS